MKPFFKIVFFSSAKNFVTADKTGGIEQSLYYFVRELSKRGHKIVLYTASKSKIPGVEVRNMLPSHLNNKYFNNLDESSKEKSVSFFDASALIDFFHFKEDEKFDLIIFFGYKFYEYLPFSKLTGLPIISQINYDHGEIYPAIKEVLKKYKNVQYLPVSNSIKKTMPDLPYLEVVYPVFDFKDFVFSPKEGKYLLFIGRICPEKGVDIAINVAKQSNKKLIIAGPIRDIDYFEAKIKPYLDNQRIFYIGEVGFKKKVELYQNALATLFPIRWNEPFGIVAVESMACGTPVIAFDRAAMREIIKNGINGYIVKDGDVGQMVRAVKEISKIERKNARKYAEKLFSLEKWTDKLENICLNLAKYGKK